MMWSTMVWNLAWTLNQLSLDQLLKRKDDRYELTLPVELWNGRASLTITRVQKEEESELRATNLDQLCEMFCHAVEIATGFQYTVSAINHKESIVLLGISIKITDNNTLILSNIGPMIAQRMFSGNLAKIELEVREFELEQI
jgi:hypothetical protein